MEEGGMNKGKMSPRKAIKSAAEGSASRVFNFLRTSMQIFKTKNLPTTIALLDKARELVGEDAFVEQQSNSIVYGLIAELYLLFGSIDLAEEMYSKFQTTYEAVYGTDHVALSDCYSMMAAYKASVGNYEDAVNYSGQALSLRIHHLGLFHPCTADSHYNLGLMLRVTGNLGDARRELYICRGIRREISGPFSTEIAIVDITAGQAERLTGQYDVAFLLFNESYQIRKRLVGPSHPDSLLVRGLMNDVRHKLGEAMYSFDELRDVVKTVRVRGSRISVPLTTWEQVLRAAKMRGFLLASQIRRHLTDVPGAMQLVLEFFEDGVDHTEANLDYQPLGYSLASDAAAHAAFNKEKTDLPSSKPGSNVPEAVSLFDSSHMLVPSSSLPEATPFSSPPAAGELPQAVLPLSSQSVTLSRQQTMGKSDEAIDFSNPLNAATTLASNAAAANPSPLRAPPIDSETGRPKALHEPVQPRINVAVSPMLAMMAAVAGSASGKVEGGGLGVFSRACVDVAIKAVREMDTSDEFEEQLMKISVDTACTLKMLQTTFPRRYREIQIIIRFAQLMRPKSLQQSRTVAGYAGEELRKALHRTRFLMDLNIAAFPEFEKIVANKGSLTPADIFQICPNGQDITEVFIIAKSGGFDPPEENKSDGYTLDINPALAMSKPTMDQQAVAGKSKGWMVVFLPNPNGKGTNPFFYHERHGYLPAMDKGGGNFIVDISAARSTGKDEVVIPSDLVIQTASGGGGSSSTIAPARKHMAGMSGEDLWKSLMTRVFVVGAFPFLLRKKVISQGAASKLPPTASALSDLPPAAGKSGPPLPPAMPGKGGPPMPPSMPGKKGMPPPLPGGKAHKERGDGPRMKQLHWETITATEGTIFQEEDYSNMNPTSPKAMEAKEMFPDLESEFTNKPTAQKAKPKEVGPGGVSLIDSKKSQNMNIMLGALGKRSMVEVCQHVKNVETQALGLQAVLAMLDFVPEQEEIDGVNSFVNSGGDVALLGKPEKYIMEVSKVPRLRARLQSMLLELTFDEIFTGASADVDLIGRVVLQVRNSHRFKKLLRVILKLGNELNTSSGREVAAGFKVSAIMKITQTKTNTGATLMEYIIRHLRETLPDILQMSKDFVDVTEASHKNIMTLQSELAKLKRGTETVAMLVQLCQSEGDLSVVERLAPFQQRSSAAFAELEKKEHEMISEFNTLCQYLGEDPTTMDPEQLFGIIDQFTNMFNGTLKKIDDEDERKKKAVQREKERQDMVSRRSGTSKGLGATPPPALMQKQSSERFNPAEKFQEMQRSKSNKKMNDKPDGLDPITESPMGESASRPGTAASFSTTGSNSRPGTAEMHIPFQKNLADQTPVMMTAQPAMLPTVSELEPTRRPSTHQDINAPMKRGASMRISGGSTGSDDIGKTAGSRAVQSMLTQQESMQAPKISPHTSPHQTPRSSGTAVVAGNGIPEMRGPTVEEKPSDGSNVPLLQRLSGSQRRFSPAGVNPLSTASPLNYSQPPLAMDTVTDDSRTSLARKSPAASSRTIFAKTPSMMFSTQPESDVK